MDVTRQKNLKYQKPLKLRLYKHIKRFQKPKRLDNKKNIFTYAKFKSLVFDYPDL